ncbi:MAG: nickel-dependent lactate racemase [Lachnospiraceae bacterium]|nr:nickel-dependent lactate racemase [Candidatus Equihabitans merdae]
MQISFGFGTGTQVVEVPDKNVIDILHANEVEHELEGADEVRRALANPIGAPLLKDVVKPGEKIAIITSDITRPMPSYVVVPVLLDALYEIGCKKEDITVVFGLGSHRKQTPEEMKKLVGERAYSEVKCVDSDPDDCVHMGTTKMGTPVDITRVVAEADKRICLGNIEYHYFAGYSGGSKAIMPGVSTRNAIQNNHSRMVQEEACAGRLEGNPVREDIEESGEICGIDYIINVVLDEHKHVIMAAAGDKVAAHREACRFLDRIYRKDIPERADIVLVSQGGAPKDLNLYQTQKALDNAKHAIKKGGVIILIGSCKEGLGERCFEEWMTTSEKAHDMIDRIKVDFQLGGHKAAAIAMVLENADIYLVSDLEDDFVRSIFLEPKSSAQAALDDAFAKLGPDATVLAMPYGGSTLPHAAK